MSAYLLDTNIVSLLLRGDPHIEERYAIAKAAGDLLLLSTVVEYEIKRGLLQRNAVNLARRFENLANTLEHILVGRAVWLKAAELWALSRNGGQTIEDADLLIAAQAIELEAVLVTRNLKHFGLFQPVGLRIESWS